MRMFLLGVALVLVAACNTKPSPRAATCDRPEPNLFEELPPSLRALAPPQMDPDASDALAQEAQDRLYSLAHAQIARFDREKSFLVFPNGATEADWKALGVDPGETRYVYKAVAEGPRLKIVAEANLDSDPFADRWLVEYDGKNRCPTITQLALDSVNASFEKPGAGVPYTVVGPGENQPRAAGYP